MKIMSNGGRFGLRRKPSTSWQTTSPFSDFNSRRLSRRAVASAGVWSTRVALAAPRDKASRPSAPEPANRSRQSLPARWKFSQLNRVSRVRAGLGRTPPASGKRSFRLRQSPPIMRSSPPAPVFLAAPLEGLLERCWPEDFLRVMWLAPETGGNIFGWRILAEIGLFMIIHSNLTSLGQSARICALFVPPNQTDGMTL